MASSSAQPPPPSPPRSGELEEHLDVVSPRIIDGKVIPFLGAGANLCGRPPKADWQREHYLPTGTELAEYLAADYPNRGGDPRALSRISESADLSGAGDGVLFENLGCLFAGEYEPNALHHLLAAMP